MAFLSFFIHSLLWWYFCMWLSFILAKVLSINISHVTAADACPYGTVLTADSACLVFVSSEWTAKYKWPSFLFRMHSCMLIFLYINVFSHHSWRCCNCALKVHIFLECWQYSSVRLMQLNFVIFFLIWEIFICASSSLFGMHHVSA